MRPRRDPPASPLLTRRALGSRLTAVMAGIGIGHPGVAAQAAPAMDPNLRDAALRGLALADRRGDPVGAAAAEAVAARLSQTDPEGALLLRLYRRLDVRPAAYWSEGMVRPGPAEADLSLLHDAIRRSRPVEFGYTDLSGNVTARVVLPLALVHPPQGVKLLAWCEERQDFRQFFVRAMSGLQARPGDFADRRMTLLKGLAEKEGA